MKKFFIKIPIAVLVFCLIAVESYGQEKDIPKDLYIAATIPDSLKIEANSVLRYGMESTTVLAPGKTIEKVHTIVTILNEKANDNARIILSYDKKFNSISSFEMRVYDANGNMIKKYHKSDMYDRTAVDDESMITDERILALGHTIANYPVTIEMVYESDNKSTIDLGSWDIQQTEQSIQNSYCRFSINSGAGFRYLNKNTTCKPVKTTNDKTDIYLWQVSNLKAVKPEQGSVSWRVLPKIYFAADNFEYYGVPGNISSWQNYGKWQQALNTGMLELGPQRIKEIQAMTEGIKTDKEKARFLYNYMQKSVRYVSIQLGIGGLKPFPAAFVDQKKYGDCKALCNYMCALLKAVNIPAYYAKVRSGTNEEPYDPTFPNDLSNHIIVCIPFKNDTTWLECTSSTQPFGKLGAFTENRNALLVTEDGGKLVNTPRSTMQDNQFNSEVHLTINADGGAKAEIKILGSGSYQEEYVAMESLKFDEQKELLMHALNLKQPMVFDIKPSSDKEGVKEVDLNLAYDKYCDIMAGDKQFYRPGVVDICAFTVPVEENRKTDYYFETPLQKSCVTVIDLPVGFEIETLPVNQSLKFSYGNFEVSYSYDAVKNQVISTSKFNLTSQVIPAAKYNEMQQYLDAVAKAQNKKLVIKRKA